MRTLVCASILLLACGATAAELDWRPFQDTDVVEILTDDEDGAARETKIWIVAFDGRAYVRTNDSRWLANIRRGSPVALRLGETQVAVLARETADAEIVARVEAAFREKYGWVQRVMSTFRMSEPTLLELSAR